MQIVKLDLERKKTRFRVLQSYNWTQAVYNYAKIIEWSEIEFTRTVYEPSWWHRPLPKTRNNQTPSAESYTLFYSYVVQTLRSYMHTIRRKFKSSYVRWFKIMNTTKQLVYQTALILCSELESTLYYTWSSAHAQYLFFQVFFFTSYPNTCTTVLLTIKSKDRFRSYHVMSKT